METKIVGVAILIVYNIQFKTKTVIIEKQEHEVMIKYSIQQKDRIYKYICTQHITTKRYKAGINGPKGRN